MKKDPGYTEQVAQQAFGSDSGEYECDFIVSEDGEVTYEYYADNGGEE